ncbi:DUF5134 domain-containing protein [Streptomyces sp. NPDC008086]|uniref:DUF5134 domain-containing protein n=1 Tax=Streptomyces sp. NPDC008086 TaxID=3364807 RepID=UPI0036E951A0
MLAADVVNCTLTALFTAAAVQALRHGVLSRGSGRRDRVDQLLHTAMALAMAVMPWSWGRLLPQAPTTVFFAAAALWFPLTAVGRRPEPWPTAIRRSLPYAAGMAAMAWMTYSTADPSHEPPTEGLPAMHQAVHVGHVAEHSQIADAVTGVLALCLLGCALRSLTREMPALGRARRMQDGSSTGKPYRHFWDGSMSLGTVVMLLMRH